MAVFGHLYLFQVVGCIFSGPSVAFGQQPFLHSPSASPTNIWPASFTQCVVARANSLGVEIFLSWLESKK